MAQLDDRDQLARRVSELARQEQKLLLRCTAIEQERSALTDKLGALTTAVTEGQQAQSKLRYRLQQMESDRDEAVRHNLNLQVRQPAIRVYVSV
jgi:chromosome segregation ATPase